jgi:tRNA-binding EMAP/Myf-like protein
MKKVIVSGLFMMLFALVSTTASAQCCAGKSTAEKASCASKSTAMKSEKSEAMLVAMKEQNIEEKVCSTSGMVSFYAKSDNLVAGPAQEMAFDESIGRFVNVSPKKACCSKEEAKACSSKDSGKACCASKGKAEMKS